MSEFTLNTNNAARHAFFHALPDFAKGYLEAALFLGIGYCDESAAIVEINGLGLNNMRMDLLEGMASDAIRFQRDNAKALSVVCSDIDYDMIQAGRDFWFTRNGHVVGYWDRVIDPDISGGIEALKSLIKAALKAVEFPIYAEPRCKNADPLDSSQWIIESDFLPKPLA